MSNNIRIAVVIAAFNAEKYIERCIHSLQKQTYLNWVAYIVNDGSNDNTSDMLVKLKTKERRIVYLNTENRGVFSARRAAIDLVQDCKYLTFMDSDDYFCDEKILEKCIYKMESENVECLNFNYEHLGMPGFKVSHEVIWNNKFDVIKNLLSRECIDGNMPYAVYLTDLVKKYFRIYSYNNDDFFNKYDLLINSSKVAYEPWCAYFYYSNSESQTHKDIREVDYLYYKHSKEFVDRIESEYPELRNECNYFRCWVLLWIAGQLEKSVKFRKYNMYRPIMNELKMNEDIYFNNRYFTKKEKLTYMFIRMHLFGICYRIYHAIR